MANTKSANGTEKQPTTAEMKQWYEQNKTTIENFAKASNTIHNLRDVTQSSNKSISTIDKQKLINYIKNIGSNEKNLRDTARYLYYRSNVFFRLVSWYADMWNLRCRKVVPRYDFVKDNDKTKFLKSYNDTLDVLDRFDLQGNMTEVLTNVYISDIYYGIRYTDDVGTFFYYLDPDDCIIDSRYSTGDFGFAVDMSKWKSKQRQAIIEYLGEPLKSMYSEYDRTKVKYIHMPDEYAVCFKFRTDIFDICIPPLLGLFAQLSGLEDLVDVQAEADKLSIYKMIYLPMKTLGGTKEANDFTVSPEITHKYFQKMLDLEAIPENVSAAITTDELKVIDFSKSADGDINAVQKSQDQILALSGGGAVLNTHQITSTAAFNAWLKAETEFALSTLMPQVNGAVNRWLSYELNNPAKVEHFEVSVYTQKELADQLLESCKYSYSNRIAYNTLLGISEKETMAFEFLENEVLKLPQVMVYPLNSSFTQSGTNGEVGTGRDKVDDDQLTPEGERSRNR